MLDVLEDAGPVYDRAIALLENLVRDEPADPRPRRTLARVLRNRSLVFSAIGQHEQAHSYVDRSVQLFGGLAQADHADVELWGEWGDTDMLRIASLMRLGRPENEMLMLVEKVRSTLEPVVRANAGSAVLQFQLAQLDSMLAGILGDSGRAAEAIPKYEQSIDRLEKLFQADPENSELAHELCRTLGNLSISFEAARGFGEGMVPLRRARQILETALKAHPTEIRFRANVAWLESLMGDSLMRLGSDAEALEAFEMSRQAREALIKANPAVTRSREQLLRALDSIATIHRRHGRLTEAADALERLIAVADRLAADQIDAPYNKSVSAAASARLGEIAGEAGNCDAAGGRLEKAASTLRRLAEAHPSEAATRTSLASTLRLSALVHRQCGRPAAAAQALRQAIAIYIALPKPSAEDIYGLVCCQSLLARLATVAGSNVSARDGEMAADDAARNLGRTLDAGFNDLSRTTSDTDLIPIRSRADVQARLLDAGFPSNPFWR